MYWLDLMSEHQFEEENAKKINDYIQKHFDCKLNKTHSVIIKGESHDVQVYKLPLELLFFNIKNGRFAAEYLELKEKIGRELHPENPDDAKTIQKMLIELDPKHTLELGSNIRKFGQRDPGICTYGGFVHNGNRRMAVMQTIVEEGDIKFNFLEVALLQPGVEPVDLWLIEAGIQLAKPTQLDYGPINTLIKFKEGIDLGLSPQQIAKNLFGFSDEKQVLEKLEILKMITKYLKFIGEPERYKKADGIVEHFIDLNKILTAEKRSGASTDELLAYQNIGFQLIFDGVTQRELRQLKKIISEEKSKQQLFKALEHSKPEPVEKKLAKKLEADENDSFTPARTIFNEANDTVKAIKDSSQPLTNLERAFTNLDTIDERNKTVIDAEFQSLLDRIEKIVQKLKK